MGTRQVSGREESAIGKFEVSNVDRIVFGVTGRNPNLFDEREDIFWDIVDCYRKKMIA